MAGRFGGAPGASSGGRGGSGSSGGKGSTKRKSSNGGGGNKSDAKKKKNEDKSTPSMTNYLIVTPRTKSPLKVTNSSNIPYQKTGASNMFNPKPSSTITKAEAEMMKGDDDDIVLLDDMIDDAANANADIVLQVSPKQPPSPASLWKALLTPKVKEVKYASKRTRQSAKDPAVFNILCEWIGCEFRAQKPSHMKLHIQQCHQEDRPFLCPEPGCGKAFKILSGLTNHTQDVHEGARTGKSMCQFCQKYFNSHTLKQHEDYCNADSANFHCDVCTKYYKTLTRLNNHIRKVHSNQKHQCQDCPQYFKTYSKLKEHSEIHMELRFLCHLCSVDFGQSKGLSHHLKSSHKDAPYLHKCEIDECDEMGKSCPTFEKYYRHQQKHHKIPITQERQAEINEELKRMKDRFLTYRDIDSKWTPTTWGTYFQNPVLDVYMKANNLEDHQMKPDYYFEVAKSIGYLDALFYANGLPSFAIEIKCLYRYRNRNINEVLAELLGKDLRLHLKKDGTYQVRSCRYLCQVLVYLYMNDLEFVDFVVVGKIPESAQDLLQIRIEKDSYNTALWTRKILPAIQKVESKLGKDKTWSFSGHLARVLEKSKVY